MTNSIRKFLPLSASLFFVTACLVFLPGLSNAQLQDSPILRMVVHEPEVPEDSSKVQVQDWAIPVLILKSPIGPDNQKHVARWFFNQPWPGIPTTITFSKKQKINRLNNYKRLPAGGSTPLVNFPNH
jgi:hypothetical protein